MPPGSPSRGNVHNLVFWSGKDVEEDIDDDRSEPPPVEDLLENLQELQDPRLSQEGKPESMYVAMFHGPPENIIAAMKVLCGDKSAPEAPKRKPSRGTAADVICISDDEEDPVDEIKGEPIVDEKIPIVCADDETSISITLKELLECLRREELNEIAKIFKVKTALKQENIITELLKVTYNQSTLNSLFQNSNSKKMHQTKLPFGQPETQQGRLRAVVIKKLTKCIRVRKEMYSIFHRINLIYFRSTIHAPSLLTPAILSKSNKRYYALYESKRTPDIWATRQDLLDYEEALRLEADIVALLDGGGRSGTAGIPRGSKTPARNSKFRTPATPASASIRNSSVAEDEDAFEVASPDSPRCQNAKAALEIFYQVYPQWQALVEVRGEEEGRPAGLERFHAGHVLTRIVCKGAAGLGVLSKHEEERKVYEALLSQKRWRKGRRGAWYERWALLLMKSDEEVDDYRAMDVVKEALLDDDTHISTLLLCPALPNAKRLSAVFRPKLQRRLIKLEKKLKIPAEERHTCAASLDKAAKRFLTGTRIRHTSNLHLDSTGRAAKPESSHSNSTDASKMQWTPGSLNASKVKAEPIPAPEAKPQGKSIWEGSGGEKVNVETLALQHYATVLGYKGFHSEGSIVRTLFGLLFWDIIFANVPGAFETPYQSAPLDIAEDCFYHARENLIKNRLDEIEQGLARELLDRTDDEHRATGTWCVGVRWDLFTKVDLLEIVDTTQLEEAVFRTSSFGITNGKIRILLIRVDQVWIDVLLRAGAEVEVCHVIENGQEEKKPRTKKTATSSATKRKPRSEKKRSGSSRSSSQWGAGAGSEDENDTSHKDGAVNDDGDTLPALTIKTRFQAKSLALELHLDTDEEEVDELDPTPPSSQTLIPQSGRGTKRKSEDDLFSSPTSRLVARSASQLIPEVVIATSSPKKRRTA
ncbi:hypothetical protein HWV62_26482 [Athelia sp. TMB]|nr:hypothetical protein HWV62_26482 [Athelia sp. TMB]